MTFHAVFRDTEFETSKPNRPNLREIRNRIDRLVASGVPETAKLARVYQPKHLVDAYGFEVPEDYSAIPNSELVQRFVDSQDESERAELRRQIEERLG